jgi:hypothetical protein
MLSEEQATQAGLQTHYKATPDKEATTGKEATGQ